MVFDDLLRRLGWQVKRRYFGWFIKVEFGLGLERVGLNDY
jgi:hypothetical protein